MVVIDIKENRKIVLFITFIVILSALYQGCNKQSQRNTDFVKKNNISSFKIHNIGLEEKEIKNKVDRDKIIDLINSVKIIKSDVEQRAGVGYGVTITYADGKRFSSSFLSSTMVYSIDDKTNWCEIDKNIVDKLRNYYDKN